MADVLTNLIKCIQENLFPISPLKASSSVEESSKEDMTKVFYESLLYSIALDAINFIKSSNFRRFLKINFYPETGIVQLEISINGLNIPKISLDCLDLTDYSVLNINLIYKPNVIYTYI